jgi:hypothetical protein
MFRPPTTKALACLLIVFATALLGCGDTTPKVKAPKSWLHIPITLEPGTRLQFRVDIEQQLSHGKDSTSTVKSAINLDLHIAKREGGALRVEVTRTGDGEGKDFHFHILPNNKFERVRNFEFPRVVSTTHGEYDIEKLTQPHFWLHDMLRPFLKSRFEENETWDISPVFDGVPFAIPMLLTARITKLDAERMYIEAKGGVAWATMEMMGARELIPWARKSLRTHSGRAVVKRSDGLVESAEWTLELTNDRDWTLQDGSFPEPDGQYHTVRHTIRVTRL